MGNKGLRILQGVAAVAAAFQAFAVDAVGSSAMAWDATTPNGGIVEWTF